MSEPEQAQAKQAQAELKQASAVAIDGRAILIEGEPGIGKSSLALALIDRGAILIGDDGVKLTRKGAQIIAAPPPNIAGKLEIRHVGIVDMPTCAAALALVIRLSGSGPESGAGSGAADIARFVETAGTQDYLGCPIPYLPLPAHDGVLPLRVEWALRQHGC